MSHIDGLVKGLTSATLLLRLYPEEHPRVKQAIDEIAENLWALTNEGEPVDLLVYEGQLVHKGKLLYEASLAGARLIEAIVGCGAHGIRFQPGVSKAELQAAVRVMATARSGEPLADVRKRIREAGAAGIDLVEESVGEFARPDRTKLADGLSGRMHVSQKAYTLCLEAMRDLTANLRAGREISAETAMEAVSVVVESSQLDPGVLRWLTRVAENEEFTFNQAVNTCVLAVQAAAKLASDARIIQEIGQAALLHDIGMFGIPKEIIYKPEALTEEERKVIEEHPVRGAKILAETPNVGPLAVQAAYFHHVAYDGSGYPAIRPSTRIGLVPRLIAVVDAYAAITSRRPFREPAQPEVAMGILLELAGKRFDPRAVAVFIDAIGIYPIGTAVSLDTGEIAVVAALSPGEPMRPDVRILTDANGEPLDEPVVVSLLEEGPDGRPSRSIVQSIDLEARLVPIAYPGVNPPAAGAAMPDVQRLGAGLLRA